ncbi:MAG: SpoIIE family protein phosphatase [Bacteroidales bacterium]|nr:SpoIIE family protein phosphatase [Bacteroidales bacterium]
MHINHIVIFKRVIRLACLVILFFTGSALSTLGQTFSFYKYSVFEGLSSSKVYKVIQDRNDYLWLGTESGLTRFDGQIMENISIYDGLSQGGVYSIFEDSRDLIWFGHLDGGLTYYDGSVFHMVDLDTLEITGDITSIQEYNNRLWFTTTFNGAFSAVIEKNNTFSDIRQYRGGEGLSDQVSNSYIDSQGVLYCMADVGIKIYLPEEDKFGSYRPEGMTSYFSTIVMFEDSRGDRWFGTYHGGLYHMDKETGKFSVYDIRDGLANNWVSYITEDSRGRVWVGTFGGGISVFDGDQIQNYNVENGLEAMAVRCLLEDREGNMLIASQKNGMNIFKGDHFVNYDSDRLFLSKNVTAINEDKFSRLWFGNYDGITIYDPESRISWSYDEESHSIGKDVTAIRNDLNGNIWVGTNGSGIFRYMFSNNSFTSEERINEILYQDLIVTAMVVDHENNLWIGTHEGVGVWSTSIKEGIRYTQINGLSGNEITSLFVDNEGYVWIGTMLRNGLSRYNPKTGLFGIVDIGYDLSPTAITQTPDGTIWLGTTYGVLAVQNDTVIHHITERDGLLSNDIKLIQPDYNGYLYIGTNFGLNRYNLATKKVNTYTAMNGFKGIQTNPNASISDESGQLWFGTVNGVTCLKPDLIPDQNIEPLTHIKAMMVNLEPTEMKDGLRLSYKEKSLVFDYYSICLTNPEAVKYKVMLQGAELEWGLETEQTRAVYPSLSPGRYVFMVKALNSDGIWNSEPQTFSFVIRPPFYFNPLFIVLVIIVLIIAIWVYIKVRERNLIIEKQILEEKVEERTAEVVQKSLEIEEKNRDITASIRYAERIQLAMLPPEDSIDKTFILFLPKDIVSGDFYWMHDNGDKQFIAAVDCTGHGVPGAFMSIIGYNSLSKIVREYGITRPSAILDQLNVEVTRFLLQRGEKVINDGMDLALIAYDKSKMKVEYAGAYNPLVVVRSGEIRTIKADRFPIGMVQSGQKKFTNNEVDLQTGDMLYLFSDGYADQFGGPDLKKFKSVNLKNELGMISEMPIVEQKEHLHRKIDDWRGEQTQIDDILIIGTRIS